MSLCSHSLSLLITNQNPLEELKRLIALKNKVLHPYREGLEIINLGSAKKRKEVNVGIAMHPDSYQDMLGLDNDMVEHKIPLEPSYPLIKQKLRRMSLKVSLKIKEEVKKQLEAGFLTVAKYPQWLANIVPVPKKDGKVRMCVDYRDLNRTNPKDDFHLPHIDILVDNTARHACFSFMDGFSGYNQIKMAPEDMEKTTFITQWGTFYYKVMPFGLKNAGATYQRAMIALFHDMMHKEVEVYVDDMIVKCKTDKEHIQDLKKSFARLRKYCLHLNPAKFTFGVKFGKLLGFIISERGIEVDPNKVRAIQEMSPPRTNKEVRSFLGRINYIARFISQLTSCILAQHDESGKKEQALYYFNKKFTKCEMRYSSLERTCCALAWATQRLRSYMLSHTTWLISKMDPIKYIFEKSALVGKITRWQVALSEYDIVHVMQKAIKGSILADYLAHNNLVDYQPMRHDFLDEDIFSLTDKAR
ncbi:Retrovirus-related Pol polyprotein from transposon 17.6, partial [Mucuna pruriens]